MADFKLTPLRKALAALAEALNTPKSDIVRDAAIQRFEYCFELTWKALKRYFKLNNKKDIHNIKDIFREAGNQGLIRSVEDWFGYLDSRNLTSHTYDLNTAERVYESAVKFEMEAKSLLEKLSKYEA